MRRAKLFAPPAALASWALAAALGVDIDTVRIAGPAVTAVACAVHVREELRLIRRRD